MKRLIGLLALFLTFWQFLSGQIIKKDSLELWFDHDNPLPECVVPAFVVDIAPPYKRYIPSDLTFDCAPCDNCFIIVRDREGTFEISGHFVDGYQEGEFIMKYYMNKTEIPSLRVKYYKKGQKLFSINFRGGKFGSFGLLCEPNSCEYNINENRIRKLLE